MKKMRAKILEAVYTHTCNLKKKRKREKAITLIALVITIAILIILAGVVIATLGGDNGLLTRAKQAKQAQIESEMKQELTLALQDLQIEKLGDATLDDVTQQWIEGKIQNYQCTIQEDASISGKKVIMQKGEIIKKFIIDENFQITQIQEDGSSAQLTYEIQSREGDNVKILITIKDKENGIKQIQYPDGDIAYYTGQDQKEEVGIDYTVTLGVEYKFKITSGNGQEKEETILIGDYYHKITKNLGEGISIDNTAVKAAYNKPYQATITARDEYVIDTIKVTMGGQEVAVDKETGVINIEKVTGDIEITATAKKLEIQITTPIVNTDVNATSSLGANTPKGTTLYINFKATIEGTNCTIEPSVPYSVTSNGKYKFTATGTYQNKTITKEIEVTVNQYQSAQGLVQYDAGDWTEGEINSLKNSKLYDLNASHTTSSTFKLNSDSGYDFTFGGFTYKGDTANENTAGVITSRNQSVSPQSGYGTPKYDGWQVLESKEENGKTYVTKLVHAGTPENFVYYYTTSYDAYRAEYLLSNGQRQTGWSTLSNGTAINPRSWDMYKDKELDAKGYIKEVHAMTYSEAYAITNSTGITTGIRNTGSYYWLGSASRSDHLRRVNNDGYIGSNRNCCWGVRPVVSLESGVYIASGDGTDGNPYVLAKE